MPHLGKPLNKVVAPYANGHLYIIRDRDRRFNYPRVNGRIIKSDEDRENDRTKRTFEKCTNFEIHSARFHPSRTPEQLRRYWTRELNKHPPNDIIFIYYYGGGGYADAAYSFRYPGFPNDEINAFDIFKIANDSPNDICFLLDCFIQTRFSKQWKNKLNNVEILARPEPMQDPHGNLQPGKGDFTKSICRNLEDFLQNIDGRLKGWEAVRSIYEIMADDDDMRSNPKRPAWFDKTKHESEKIINRIKICPVLTRESGPGRLGSQHKLIFVKQRIQGPGKVRFNRPTQKAMEKAVAFGILKINNTVYLRGDLAEAACPEDETVGEDVDEGFDEEITSETEGSSEPTNGYGASGYGGSHDGLGDDGPLFMQ